MPEEDEEREDEVYRDEEEARLVPPESIDTEEARVGIAPRGENEIAPGAASDLKYARARLRAELSDQRIAAEQVIFSGEVVDVTLTPINPVHQRR